MIKLGAVKPKGFSGLKLLMFTCSVSGNKTPDLYLLWPFVVQERNPPLMTSRLGETAIRTTNSHFMKPL
jgi:hypothetical protein